MIKHYSTGAQPEICLGREVFFRFRASWKIFYNKSKRHMERCCVFPPWKLKNWILNGKLTQKIATIRVLFLKIRAVFYNFWERARKTFPLHPSSYVSVVMKKFRIPLLTKRMLMRPKTNVFNVYMIFL